MNRIQELLSHMEFRHAEACVRAVCRGLSHHQVLYGVRRAWESNPDDDWAVFQVHIIALASVWDYYYHRCSGVLNGLCVWTNDVEYCMVPDVLVAEYVYRIQELMMKWDALGCPLAELYPPTTLRKVGREGCF